MKLEDLVLQILEGRHDTQQATGANLHPDTLILLDCGLGETAPVVTRAGNVDWSDPDGQPLGYRLLAVTTDAEQALRAAVVHTL